MNGTIVMHKLTSLASTSTTVVKKIWDPVWRTLTFSIADDLLYPAKAVSASLEKGMLSVAYGSRFFSQIKIKGIREYTFEEGRYPQAEAFASSLSLAISDLGASKAEITLSIPKAWAVIKTAEFPATIKENLSNVVSYELDRITPFSSENAFYDFKIVGENDGKLTIMVIAAKADMIKPYIDALSEKGIAVSRVTVNLSGIETLCRYIDRKTDSVFIEIKKEGYEGALCLNGAITGAVTGNFTSGDEKSRVETIMTGISSLTDTGKKLGKSLQMLAIMKDKSPALKELLKSEFNQSITFLNETDIKVKLPEQYREIPYATVGTVLESLWQKANALNLLKKGLHEKSGPPIILTIILSCALLAMWILYLVAPLRVEEKRLQEMDRQIMLRKEEVKKVEALKKEIEALNTDIATINDFKGKKRMALNILKELTSILPRTAWLSRVRTTDVTVELEGYAASATGILSKLEASPYFEKAEFASPTFRDTRMNSDRFNIRLAIEGVKKEELQQETDEDEEEE
jgi:general secretion pathway protein L